MAVPQPGLIQPPADALAQRVLLLEQQLDVLDAAFAGGEPPAIEAASEALHQALMEAARVAGQPGQGPLAPELRERLGRARARAASQLAPVHRAALTFERTLQVLLPREQADTYGGLASGPGAQAIKAYR